MPRLATAVAVAIGTVLLSVPPPAGAQMWIQFGSGAYSGRTADDSAPFSFGRPERDHRDRHGVPRSDDDGDPSDRRGRRDRRDHRSHERRGMRIHRDEPEGAPDLALPVPPPPEAVAAPEPAPRPNPRGPLDARPARGIVPADSPWSLGQPLPAGLPHVTLDWRRYDLPEPPPGRIYARIGRTVLLITARGRVVEDVLEGG